VRDSLLAIFKKRFNLFLKGDRDGVSLGFLSISTTGVYFNVDMLIKAESELPKLACNFINEAEKLFDSVVAKQQSVTNPRWNAEKQLFTLLYAVVKAKNPKVVIETGVANGITTNAIMKALELNENNGELHSFDVLQQTSKAYIGKGKWNFHLLNPKNTYKQIVNEITKLPKVDIWVHDSDHGYRWQKFEYLLALKSLNAGGLLISDDVDASSAWGELSKTHFRKSYIIFDSRKFIGIAIK
jgi:predicted O-methyltransferase YrrM